QHVTLWGGIIVGVILLLYGATKFAGHVTARKARKAESKDSKIEFMVSTFHDLVQKLKEKERELDDLRRVAESRAEDIESYNENILQSVPSGVISFDESLRITRVNMAAERILGIFAEDCLQRRYDDIFVGRISEVIGGSDFLERGEVLHVTPSSKRVWLGLSVSPLRNREGSVLGKIMVFTDL
ncbi:MAG: PAS domain-containing protein, partial [bacterium]